MVPIEGCCDDDGWVIDQRLLRAVEWLCALGVVELDLGPAPRASDTLDDDLDTEPVRKAPRTASDRERLRAWQAPAEVAPWLRPRRRGTGAQGLAIEAEGA